MSTSAIGGASIQQASIQSRIGVEAVKSTLDAQKAVANLVEQSSQSVPVSSSLGTKLDITV